MQMAAGFGAKVNSTLTAVLEAKPPPAPSPVDMRIPRSMFVREAGTWLAGGETDRTAQRIAHRDRILRQLEQ
jgi:hypothetical protein